MNELIKLRDRGGKVIVINPVKERGLIKFASPAFVKSLFTGSEIASIYLQPIPGSDVALFIGIQKSLIEQNKIDLEFLQAHTEFVTPLPRLTLPESQNFGVTNYTHGIVLALMTGRGYAQHNTVVYRTEDKYRGLSHRHCILMNRFDANSAGLQEHQLVTVKGNASHLDNIEIIYGEVRRGAALMFYPEVNVIFNAPVESRCGTPAFKRVPVFVYSLV